MRVAVVGSGGAGITAAWLLDERHEVTLFERSAVLGGHAHTTTIERDGRVHHADDGFCWFSDALYPTYMRLLELHGVATRIVPMSATFTQRQRGRTFVLPPTGAGPMLRTLASPSAVADLLRLNRAIQLAEPMVHGRERDLDWGGFLRRHRFSEASSRDLLTPMVAGVWGGPYDRVHDFSAYTLMKYLVFHRPSGLSKYRWHVVRDGAASYIEAVARDLARATVLRGTAVAHLEKTGAGWTIVDGAGLRRDFDHVVMATGARDAQAILRDVRGIDGVRATLDGFEYYTARLATHSDPSFMPPRRSDWRVSNISWDGSRSALTVWVGQESGSHVFTSYVGERLPAECHHVSTFNLPLITPAHYRAQDALWARQGRDGLSFVGDWTHDIGSHEDAVASALRACAAIDPAGSRMAALRAPRVHPPQRPLPGGPDA